MTENDLPLGTRASELRHDFDRSFAEAAHAVSDEVEALLGLRVGDDRYAVRLSEIRGLLPAPKIIPLPSPAPELLGIMGVRGAVVPVYSLGALLGCGPTSSSPDWIIVAGTDARVGLAFDGFEGHLRVPRPEISLKENGASRSHVREAVRVSDTLRGIINIKSLVLALSRKVEAAGSLKET